MEGIGKRFSGFNVLFQSADGGEAGGEGGGDGGMGRYLFMGSEV